MLMATRALSVIVRIKRIRNFSELHLPKLSRTPSYLQQTSALEELEEIGFPFSSLTFYYPSILITHSYLLHFWNAHVKLPVHFRTRKSLEG